MANEAKVAQPIEKVTVQGITNNNVTGRVYITGQLSSTAEAKAAELTILVDSLTKWGIFRDIRDAIKQRVPTGTFVLVPYPTSRDYYAAWKGTSLSNNQLSRPYTERMDTVITYFTNLGYTINRLTNPVTRNTITWSLQW